MRNAPPCPSRETPYVFSLPEDPPSTPHCHTPEVFTLPTKTSRPPALVRALPATVTVPCMPPETNEFPAESTASPCIHPPLSSPVPPTLVAHCATPDEFSFVRKMSLLPALVRFVDPKDTVPCMTPETYKLPEPSTPTPLPQSLLVPPNECTHATVPDVFSFATKMSLPPLLVTVAEPMVAVPENFPVKYTLPDASAFRPNMSPQPSRSSAVPQTAEPVLSVFKIR